MENKRGQIVSSKAGHDKGCFFAIIADENPYALICDGKRRPLEKPKKKKYIHLSKTNYVLSEDEMKTNRSLRKAIMKIARSDDSSKI